MMGISVRKIISLSTFKKNTSEYIQAVKEDDNPILLTINGSAALVVEDAARYEELTEQNATMKKELHELRETFALRTMLEDRVRTFDKSKALTSDEIRKKIKAKASK